MKKKLLTVLLILINAACIFILSETSLFQNKKQPVYIAVAGPMSGANKTEGEAMLRGIRLYLDKINNEKKIGDRKIKLIIFDDKNDKRVAMKVASQIADDNKVLLVLGHYYSSTSFVAGEIYKKNGIPAVTASATSESVISGNDWYFRTVPGNNLTVNFAANYIKKVLKKASASIISDTDEYGASLAGGFEKAAADQGIRVINKWEFDTDSKKLNDELEEIVIELRSVKDPGIIFFATHSAEAIKILTSLKYPGTDYSVIGSDSFAASTFLDEFNNYTMERLSPGYYSDGIYVITPFLVDIANKEARMFRKEFKKKYNEEPHTFSFCYYDAMKVVSEAIEQAGFYWQDIREDRRKLRDALARFNTYDRAVSGVSGAVYFDKDGGASSHLTVGLYQKQRLLPAFSQYQALESEGSGDSETAYDMIEIRVVYAGIDINEIRNLGNHTYTADFYLWFRFQGDFDDTSIRFTNAVNPIRLERPVMEESADNVTVRTYRVKADFKNDFDLHTYPFDHQALRVSLYHTGLPSNKLIYVADILGMPLSGADKINAVTGWNINDILYYQDTMNTSVSQDAKIQHSRFNAEIQIERKTFKVLFPVIVMTVILCSVCFISRDRPAVRVLMSITPALLTVAIHYLFFSDIAPGFIILEYAFCIIYLLSGISVLMSILSYNLHKADKEIKIITIAENPCIVLIVLTSALLLIYLYIKNSL